MANSRLSSADDLTKTSKSGDIELDEEELKRVSGGAKVSVEYKTG
jgi:bacteriocin-like protein